MVLGLAPLGGLFLVTTAVLEGGTAMIAALAIECAVKIGDAVGGRVEASGQSDEGPCLDCFRTSQPIAAPDLRGRTEWPRFVTHTLDTGYRSVHAVPLRLRTETIGALNLFSIQPRALGPDELRIAQALADVATIGILQERAIRRREVLAEQLQVALNSRIVIEQAKGVLAERGQLEMERAFEVLRGHARSTQQRLSDVALGVANRTIAADVVLGPLHGSTSP
jgi:GAF domain-containing protein